MNIWESVSGIVEVELVSADIGNALKSVAEQGIPVSNVEDLDNFTVRFQIPRTAYAQLETICRKRGERLKEHRKPGIYWVLFSARQRVCILAGFLVILFSTFFIPSRIWFIRVEGNHGVPEKQILAAAEQSGVYFGVPRRSIRSERIKNSLLEQLHDIQWIGVNTRGCTAVISVQEKTYSPQRIPPSGSVCSIIASRDGIIHSAIVTRGNLQCSVGKAVREGETLISGYTDCGEYLQAVRAEGEIYAQTEHEVNMISPLTCSQRICKNKEKKHYSLILGKKRIKLWFGSGIWDAGCGRMYRERALMLPGGYQLPVRLATDVVTLYDTAPMPLMPDEIASNLMRYTEKYLLSQMIAGKLSDRNVRSIVSDNLYSLAGRYSCVEMIGRYQWEKAGENHGENN